MTTFTGVRGSAIVSEQPARRQAWCDRPFPFTTKLDTDGHDVTVKQPALILSKGVPVERQTVFQGTWGESFSEIFYNRILIEPDYIDVGNLVTDQSYTLKVFNGFFEPKRLESLMIQNPDGLVLSGPEAGSDWGALETKLYQLTISTTGPSVVNSKIQFGWLNLNTIEIAIVGSRTVMLPYQATIPWTETLEWLTNILTSNNGTEQRIRTRKLARQLFSANYPISPEEMGRANNMIYSWMGRKWAVAVWSESQTVNNIASESTFIPCYTANFDFRPGGMLAVWQDAKVNEVVEILDVTSSGVTLQRKLGNEYVRALVMPVRTGFIKGNVTRKSSGHSANLSLTYEILDNVYYNPAPPTQFLGNDVYTSEVYCGSDGLSDTFTTRVDVVDYNTGLRDMSAPWKHSKTSRSLIYIQDGIAERFAFKQWLHRRAGRLRPFWIPTFENDFNLQMDGLVTISLVVTSNSFKGMAENRNHIAIELDTGEWLLRTITEASFTSGGQTNLTLDSLVNVDARRIRRISHMGLHRLDVDRVEIKSLGNGVSTCSVRVMEIEP